MEEEGLISKKRLLEKYGISYGALYRWKRKGLIPDEWFIKKFVPTGQETFFPEKAVCERIETILEMKDDILLDELAIKLSGEEKKNEFLTLTTVFGEKSFRLCDIKNVSVSKANGDTVEITELIIKTVKGDKV